MLIFEKLNGWHTQAVNQKYISIFSEELRTNGDIRFLGNHSSKNEILLPYLIDISKKGESICVSYYPHNDPSIVPAPGSPEMVSMDGVITYLYNDLYKKYQGSRDSFTIDLFNMCEITADDFKKYSPGVEEEKAKIFAFIFETADTEKTFPRIYLIEKRSDDTYKGVWPLLGKASRCLAQPNGKSTSDGKYLSYLLINSDMNDKFIPFAPSLAGVEFPSAANDKVSTFYILDEYDKLIRNPKIDSLRVKSGKIVDERPDEEVVPGFLVGDDSVEVDRIVREIVDKNTVNLSDILMMGADDALKLFPKNTNPINVTVDVGGFVAKMCVFEGFYYAIPKPDNESKEALLMEFGDNLVLCSIDSFPLISK